MPYFVLSEKGENRLVSLIRRDHSSLEPRELQMLNLEKSILETIGTVKSGEFFVDKDETAVLEAQDLKLYSKEDTKRIIGRLFEAGYIEEDNS